jgi:hypothetical protein
MAQQVQAFFSKAKAAPPQIEFDLGKGKEPSCTCTVTLPATFDDEGDGFAEVFFNKTCRTKKQAKLAAMQAAYEYLAGQKIYIKILSSKKVRLQVLW